LENCALLLPCITLTLAAGPALNRKEQIIAVGAPRLVEPRAWQGPGGAATLAAGMASVEGAGMPLCFCIYS
jgi:hypothetical protein